jgi:hypothetical protein
VKIKASPAILSLALTASLLGSVTWSANSYACEVEPFVGSICVVSYSRGCPSGFVKADGTQPILRGLFINKLHLPESLPDLYI